MGELILPFGILAAIGAVLVTILVVPLIIINKMVTKSQVNAQIELLKAQEELEVKKSLDWICASCNAPNHNREMCEYCGAGKPEKLHS